MTPREYRWTRVKADGKALNKEPIVKEVVVSMEMGLHVQIWLHALLSHPSSAVSDYADQKSV